MATFHRFTLTLFILTFAQLSFAAGPNMTGRFEASASSTYYQDQRGVAMTCGSGVKVIIVQTNDTLDLRVEYNCGEFPAGQPIIPHFMQGWSPLTIRNGDLLLNGSKVGELNDRGFSIEARTTSGFPSVESTVRFWADGLHPSSLFFDNVLRVNGVDMRYIKAQMARTGN